MADACLWRAVLKRVTTRWGRPDATSTKAILRWPGYVDSRHLPLPTHPLRGRLGFAKLGLWSLDERPTRHRAPLLRLPARLPVGLRARCRRDRREPHRPRAWRPGHPYTQGVVCAKVARYSERIHHPDRLSRPLRRVGPKGSAQFVPISWDEALDCVAKAFLKVECEWGAEGVWPYFYAGTMGLVMRDGIDRLTHVKRYSRFFGNICVGIAWPGFIAGTGRMSGVSPSEMAKSEVVVIWGTKCRRDPGQSDDPRDARPVSGAILE